MSHSIQILLARDTVALASRLSLDTAGARIEVQCLLQKVLHVQRVYLFAHPEYILNKDEAMEYEQILQRRLIGEPVAYILGEREFFGLTLKVTPATLIPRPDTELLVEQALQHLAVTHASCELGAVRVPAGGSDGLNVLDLGTGSGAIALAIAHARPLAQIVACDASAEALEVAKENAQSLGLGNVNFLASNWFDQLGGAQFDMIVSNPPYIAEHDPHLSQGDVRFEPVTALTAGADGLDDIRHIILQAGQHLLAGGWLLLEHGYDQADKVRKLLVQQSFTEVSTCCDLAGNDRISMGRNCAAKQVSA